MISEGFEGDLQNLFYELVHVFKEANISLEYLKVFVFCLFLFSNKLIKRFQNFRTENKSLVCKHEFTVHSSGLHCSSHDNHMSITTGTGLKIPSVKPCHLQCSGGEEAVHLTPLTSISQRSNSMMTLISE